MADDVIETGTEAWNIAEGYVKTKILIPLIECDKYERIAQHGMADIDDPVFLSEDQITERRINAMIRYKDTIKMIIGNVKFAMKKADHDTLETLRNRTLLVEEMLDGISYEVQDIQHQRHRKINERFFSTMLQELQDIKEKLNTPLNNAGLIFRQSDDFTFDELAEDIIKSG